MSERKSEGIYISNDPQSSIRSNINFYYNPSQNILSYSDPESFNLVTVSVNPNTLNTSISQAVTNHNNSTTNVHGIPNTANLATNAFVNTSVQGLRTYSDQTFATKTEVNVISNTLPSLLTISSAASTYVTQSSLPGILDLYLSDIEGASLYVSQASLPGILDAYLTESDASSIYLTQSNASSTYLTQSNAATTYSPIESSSFTGTVSLPSTTPIGDVSDTEIGYLNGVTSSVQDQINSKEKYIPLQNTAPTSPSTSDLWVDNTDPAEPILKVYNGTSWVTAGSSITADDDQIILASRVFV